MTITSRTQPCREAGVRTWRDPDCCTDEPQRSRRRFLAASGAVVAGTMLGRPPVACPNTVEDLPKIQLRSWEVTELPNRSERFRTFIKITGGDGSIGYCRALGGVKDIAGAVKAAGDSNLLDHDKLYDLMIAKDVPESQRRILDIACWDLHARMLDKPLHGLLGTKKTRILRYGLVRGTQPNFSPEKYAASVAAYLNRTGLQATKLHFPGAMGTEHRHRLKHHANGARSTNPVVPSSPNTAGWRHAL